MSIVAAPRHSNAPGSKETVSEDAPRGRCVEADSTTNTSNNAPLVSQVDTAAVKRLENSETDAAIRYVISGAANHTEAQRLAGIVHGCLDSTPWLDDFTRDKWSSRLLGHVALTQPSRVYSRAREGVSMGLVRRCETTKTLWGWSMLPDALFPQAVNPSDEDVSVAPTYTDVIYSGRPSGQIRVLLALIDMTKKGLMSRGRLRLGMDTALADARDVLDVLQEDGVLVRISNGGIFRVTNDDGRFERMEIRPSVYRWGDLDALNIVPRPHCTTKTPVKVTSGAVARQRERLEALNIAHDGWRHPRTSGQPPLAPTFPLLAHLAITEPGWRTADLVDVLGVPRRTIYRWLDTLEGHGWITRSRGRVDSLAPEEEWDRLLWESAERAGTVGAAQEAWEKYRLSAEAAQEMLKEMGEKALAQQAEVDERNEETVRNYGAEIDAILYASHYGTEQVSVPISSAGGGWSAYRRRLVERFV